MKRREFSHNSSLHFTCSAQVDMRNEERERTLMGMTDFDAPDTEQVQEQQEQGPLSWQIYYDDSTDPPTPWWFNSNTGVSTWECPVVAEDKDGPELGEPPSDNAAGGKGRKCHMLTSTDSVTLDAPPLSLA